VIVTPAIAKTPIDTTDIYMTHSEAIFLSPKCFHLDNIVISTSIDKSILRELHKHIHFSTIILSSKNLFILTNKVFSNKKKIEIIFFGIKNCLATLSSYFIMTFYSFLINNKGLSK